MASMGVVTKERVVSLAVCGLWQLFAVSETLAGQPLDKAGIANHEADTARFAGLKNLSEPAGVAASGVTGAPASRGEPPSSVVLDLRPPSQSLVGEDTAQWRGVESPSISAHRMLLAEQSPERFAASAAAPPEGRRSRALAPPESETSGHIMSPIEALAHNFHQQGLPVARLFENHTSLVHLGLNEKGKPGLWILHKLH